MRSETISHIEKRQLFLTAIIFRQGAFAAFSDWLVFELQRRVHNNTYLRLFYLRLFHISLPTNGIAQAGFHLY